jgi:hypothetical protein
MTNSSDDDVELGKAMNRLFNKEFYLEKHIKKNLQEIFEKLSDEYGLRSEFIDTTLLLLFTHIDLLGRLYAGDTSNKKTAQNAIKFMREYLGKVDVRYKEISGLLYYSLRHGYVHLFTPKRMRLKNGEELDFSFTTHNKKIKYLSIKKREENEITGSVVICRISMHVSQLYEDLLLAIDKYAEDITHNQEISDKFGKSFESRRLGDTEEELIKKYPDLATDFTYIYRQTQDSSQIS